MIPKIRNLADGVYVYVSVLKQKTTYSELQITPTLFKRLMAAFRVFPPFLDFIHGFGDKQSACDEHFNSYNSRYHFDSGGGRDGSYGCFPTLSIQQDACICILCSRHLSSSIEFCYNIRYPARNQRQTHGSPWSIRHTAVYEHHNSASGSSRWIIVQPSENLRAQIMEYLGSTFSIGSTGAGIGGLDPLELHSAVLISAERDWRSYLNDLEKDLKLLVGFKYWLDHTQSSADVSLLIRKKRRSSRGLEGSTQQTTQ